jgi:hypothetical protein
MKKTWLLILAVVTLAALGIGIAVPALASGNGNGPAATSPATDTGSNDGPAIARVAAALDLTTDDLLTRLHSGETLAQIAGDQGVTTDAVVDALVGPYADRLAVRVDNGSLTREEADQLLQTARDSAASFLTQDLSNPGDFSTWNGEMEQFCEQYLFGNANGYGPGMMNGWNGGSGYGPGACWNDGDETPANGTANRYGGNGSGGGMMGGRGFGGGMMSW